MEFPASTKNSNMHLRRLRKMLMLLSVHMTSVLFFSTGGKFHSDYGLLLELHALTLVAHSYALLQLSMVYKATPI